jgi:hypothetical protein
MSLEALQSALAALFTESTARERFARDPAAFARQHGLNATESGQLRAMSAAAITSYAATLARKRRAEAARHLTQTRAALGDEFAAAFDAWAEQTEEPPQRDRAMRDAIAFCRVLVRNASLADEQLASIRSDLNRAREVIRRSPS